MTEQEAIESLKYLKEELEDDSPDMFMYTTGNVEALGVAISALEEIQQYRAIGTVEECGEAMEKQKPKSPDIWGDGYADGKMVYDMYDCPCCGESYEIDGGKYNFCPNCGQALNWNT